MNFMNKTFRTILIFILLVATGFLVVAVVTKHKENKNTTTSLVPVLVQDSAQSQPTGTPAQVVTINIRSGTVVPTLPTPTYITPTVTPSPTPIVSANKLYKSVSAGISVTIPNTWKVQEDVRDGRNYINFYSGSNLTSSIEWYGGTKDTLEVIEQQLKSSSGVVNVLKLNVASTPALQFSSSSGTMLVLLKNTITYYVSGKLTVDTSKISF